MKKLFLALLMTFWVLQATQAQVVLLSEDFAGASANIPPTGWDQQVFAGDPLVDLWSFSNPGSRTLNAPLSSPVAIFDSDNYSNNGLPEDVALQSPVFSTLGQNNVFLKFDHYFRAISPSAYHVEVFNGSTWLSVLNGTSSTADPQSELINVSAQIANLPNARVRFRFEGNYSWYWFVDNVEVFSSGSSDIRVLAIDSLNTSCSFASNDRISLQIENLGTVSQDSFELSYAINGATAVTETYNGAAILPGMVGTYTFSTTEDLSTPGTYNLKAWTTLNGDVDVTNDTSSLVFQNLGSSPQTIAWSEDFDSFSPGTTGALANGWTNVGDYDWWATSGSTLTPGTGPDGDHTSGIGVYLYTEATSQSQGDGFVLRSPCIDISAPSFLRYHYHMHGNEMGNLEVYVVANGLSTRIDSIGGPQQAAESDPWQEVLVDLAAYTGQTILLEFRGTIGSGPNSDIALDDISVFFPLGKDLGIVSRSTPAESEDCFGPNESLSFLLFNSGGDSLNFAVDTATLDLALLGANVGMYSIKIDSGILPPLQHLTISLTGINLSNPGITQLTASIDINGDIQAANDELPFSLTTLPPVSIPYLEDFDTFAVDTFGIFPTGWKNVTQADRKWLANAGPTATTSTGPNGDHTSGNGVYLYTEATFPALNGDQFRLLSPCIDLNGSTSPELSFYYQMYGNGIDRLYILVSANGTETLLDSVVGAQQTSSFDPFIEKIVDLSSFSGLVRIEFRGIRGNAATGDIAIDDVAFRDLANSELELVNAFNVNHPENFGCFGANESFALSIKNNGATLDFGLNNARVLVEASGANSFSDTLEINNGTINLKEVQDFTISSLDLSMPGNTQLQFSILGPGDLIPQNDSLWLDVLTQPVISSFPYKEDFETGNGGFAAAERGPAGHWVIQTSWT